MSFGIMEKIKKNVPTAIPSRSLQPQQGAMFPQNTVDQSTPDSHSLPGTDIKTNLGHDFSRISVMPSKSPVDLTGFQPVAQPCPLGLVSPRACPYGGACHTCPVGVQTKFAVNQPGDMYEQEADRMAEQVMQMPGLKLQRYAARPTRSDVVPPIVNDVLSSSGQPLDPETRFFMEARFGYDFSQVRLHTDAKAAKSARAVDALAYTVGQDVVFATGQYAPLTTTGRQLLAHELTHLVQQSSLNNVAQGSFKVGSSIHTGERIARDISKNDRLRRSTMPANGSIETLRVHEIESPTKSPVMPTTSPSTTTNPRPETCPPPVDMRCPAATNSPGAVTNNLIFPVNSAELNATQKAEIDATAAAWHAAGGTEIVRINGYASAEGECGYNWNLSCRRAQAVATELESPSDGSPGVPNGNLEAFAHGESEEAGRALAPNRRATISIPTVAPSPTPQIPPACTLPVRLGGRNRGCRFGPDFAHFDFPSISAVSAAKLAVWAGAHGRGPFRSLVTDLECALEMDGVLTTLAGSAGHAAFSRFVAGTGGTVTHSSASTLGAMALASGSFLRTVTRVQTDIEAQLATQAAGRVLNPCTLSVTPPATFFQFSDGTPLKSVIGGTQGEELFVTGFTGSIPMRSYSIDLRFVICDDFGVDESDLYAPGLFAFWVLQHERSPSHYIPFINELDLPITVKGTF